MLQQNPEAGFSIFELMVVLAVVLCLGYLTVPRVLDTAKETATRADMSRICGAVVLAECSNGPCRSLKNLSELRPTFYPNNYTFKDPSGEHYTFDKNKVRLCSKSLKTKECLVCETATFESK